MLACGWARGDTEHESQHEVGKCSVSFPRESQIDRRLVDKSRWLKVSSLPAFGD